MSVQTPLRSTPDRSTPVHPQQVQTLPTPRDLGMRLLHIEDNSADALLAQSYLRSVDPDVQFETVVRLGDVTRESADGAACAILDLSLPDATGLEALHSLRALSPELPIIVLTGFDDLDMGLDAIRHGAEDYLVKNYVDGDSLQRAVRYAIERRRLISALAGPASVERAPAVGAIPLPAAVNLAPTSLSRRDFFAPSSWFG
jgi:DNA-binding NarL/FixJ family response regulator